MFARNKAQSSIEMVIALICALILFLGSVKIFSWANSAMVTRQQWYDSTRVAAGSSSPGEDNNDGNIPGLTIF
jgi:hypothetical protein